MKTTPGTELFKSAPLLKYILSAGYNNYEKPYFCTKTELQLHFRGKHTKEYLEMVSAVTGKPAGKEVQLGRHNHLKANLNIKGLK